MEKPRSRAPTPPKSRHATPTGSRTTTPIQSPAKPKPNTITEPILLLNNKGLELITEIPEGTVELVLSNNNLSSLPILPKSLRYLTVENNQLSALPDLPHNLIILNCNNNKIVNLPTLPETLETLECADNLISELPKLPKNMDFINISGNHLETRIADLYEKYIDAIERYQQDLTEAEQTTYMLNKPLTTDLAEAINKLPKEQPPNPQTTAPAGLKTKTQAKTRSKTRFVKRRLSKTRRAHATNHESVIVSKSPN
jgi:hypothetical protein